MNFEYIDRDMIVICVKFWYDWLYQFTGFFAEHKVQSNLVSCWCQRLLTPTSYYTIKNNKCFKVSEGILNWRI